VQDHDFVAHLRTKLGVTRLLLDEAPDLHRKMHIVVAKDWNQLRKCIVRGTNAIRQLVTDNAGDKAWEELAMFQ
jgi:hypothetical protein